MRDFKGGVPLLPLGEMEPRPQQPFARELQGRRHSQWHVWRGKQQPEAFEGGVSSVLEQTFLETSTQLGMKLTAVQANEEAIEASTGA